MKFVVMGRSDLEAGNPCDLQHVIISIRGVGQKMADVPSNSATLRVLKLLFDDSDAPNRAVPNQMLFDEEHAEAIVKMVEETEPEVVICQCEAGISRSAAVAAALSKFYMGDDMFFFQSRRFNPNRLVYRVLLETLNRSLSAMEAPK
jgi:predicted protein tyrosine phosphatase